MGSGEGGGLGPVVAQAERGSGGGEEGANGPWCGLRSGEGGGQRWAWPTCREGEGKGGSRAATAG